MDKRDEHDDDLEPQVVDAADTETGIETETFLDADDLEDSGSASEPEEDREDDSADSL